MILTKSVKKIKKDYIHNLKLKKIIKYYIQNKV